MKKNFSISIPKPCAEKWGNFTTTSTGGFCTSCNKNVVDFSVMSETEIREYFMTNTGSTCGRFRPDQLKYYTLNSTQNVRPGMILLKAGFLGLGLLLMGKQTFAQAPIAKPKTEISRNTKYTNEISQQSSERYVKGIVKSADDGSPLPGVNVVLKGSSVGTVTDVDGRFEFPKKLDDGNVLVFSFIGIATQEITIRSKNNEDIVLVMMLSDVVTLGEVAVDSPYTEKKSAIDKLWANVKNLF